MCFEHIQLTHEPFSPQKLIEDTAGSLRTKGGVASFTGYVRPGESVELLELTHYDPLTYPGMEDIAIAAQNRFSLSALTIVHRIGTMRPGDPIVLVAAAARHRRGAIDAVDFCMDHLKAAAWFWKREKRSGSWHWIEPREDDYADLARWSE